MRREYIVYPFSEEEEEEDSSSSDETSAADYAFDGFQVEFSEKLMLSPYTVPKQADKINKTS
jgi:hypothetical protein